MNDPVAIGVDIGGTSAKLGVVDAQQAVVVSGSVPTGRIGPERLTQAIVEESRRLLGMCGASAIGALGIGCAGLVDTTSGVIRLSPNLPAWRDVPLRALVADSLGVPVALLNDANAFAYAEATYGAGRGSGVGVYVTLGTGVGGAIMVDGRFHTGTHDVAGEIGHMCIALDGPICACGGRGCFETFVGIAAIVALTERKIRSGAPGAAIVRAAGGPGAPITPKAVAQAAAEGDWTATAVYAEVGRIVGTVLAGVGNLLDPDVFVVGGGVAQAGEVLFAPMRAAYDRQAIAPPDIRASVAAARFGNDAGLIGAATFARDAG